MKQRGKATILIVDEKSANIFALENLLAGKDRILINAMNGKDALKIAMNKDIDLIILDVQMPGMDGFEVAQLLKSNKRTKDIPIIFASAEMKEHKLMMKGYEVGAIDYLFKPLDPEVVKAKVAVFLKIQLQKKEMDEKIKRLNADLQINVEQLETTNKELESFSYSISHDLRAPLRALSGYSKIIWEDYAEVLDEEAKRLLGNIQFNAKQMGILIDDLLAFSRLSRKEVEKSPVSMKEIVAVVVDEITKTTGHHAEIRINTLPVAEADYNLLRQVWVNLVSNAVKYSDKKSSPKIEIGSAEAENEITYYVKDNGAGFNMEYADKLFGVFQRLHTSEQFEGTGIGLAIVQRIITKHKGKVWADAKVNEGATFYFSLPKPKDN